MTINVITKGVLYVDSYGVRHGMPQPNSCKHIANNRLAIAFAGALPIKEIREKFFKFIDSKMLAYYQHDMETSSLRITRAEMQKFFQIPEDVYVCGITSEHVISLEFETKEISVVDIEILPPDIVICRGNGGHFFLSGLLVGRDPKGLMCDVRLVEETSGGTLTTYHMSDLTPYPTLTEMELVNE